MTCELCETNSPRLNANQRCCQVRLLAKMPKHVRQQHYDKIRNESGNDAMLTLIAEVKQAHQLARVNALKAAGVGKVETREAA